jgi:uncharacterized membrane protein YidH (DUF202 family)
MPERSDTLVRDRLARQRTELANERTLLSYIRTARRLHQIEGRVQIAFSRYGNTEREET